MIQVIQRVFTILEELNRDGVVHLESLVRITGLNKGTLCNILRSLIELNYVQRVNMGSYALTEKINNLRRERIFTPSELEIMQKTVNALAEATQESGVLTHLHNSQVEVICQAQYQRTLMINIGEVYAALSLFHSTSGRILFAALPSTERHLICQRLGYPGTAWDNIKSAPDLDEACNKILKKQISIMENSQEEIIAFAVPVKWFNQQTLSLGMTMPLERCRGRNKKQIIEILKAQAQELSDFAQN